MLWKHVDHDIGAEVRRMRRLTLSFHVTVANYEYLVYWRLYQDGNIECEVRATGIMVTTPLVPGQPNPNGTLVDERTYAPFHQHFLVARLDLDIDGPSNTVYTSESYAEPMGPDNPVRTVGGAAQRRAADRGGGQAGRRLQHPAGVEGGQHQRHQRPGHPSVLQAGAGRPRSRRCSTPTSPVLQRANVIGHTLWVTPNHPDERWPAGEFVNQSVADTGLGQWTKAEPSDREHRRRAVVRVRPAPHHPARGLAGDARRTWCRSGSSRSASSTATRHSTCPRRHRRSATRHRIDTRQLKRRNCRPRRRRCPRLAGCSLPRPSSNVPPT